MTKATPIRTTFNWVWLTGSEVQTIITKVWAWQHPGKHGAGGAEVTRTQCQQSVGNGILYLISFKEGLPLGKEGQV